MVLLLPIWNVDFELLRRDVPRFTGCAGEYRHPARYRDRLPASNLVCEFGECVRPASPLLACLQ